MENTTQLLIALCCATGALSLFVILRRTLRSPATPTWLAGMIAASIFALALTAAFAASLVYLAFALQLFVPAAVAILATFVIHGALFAVCSAIVPAEPADPSRRPVQATDQAAGAMA